ncbi:MAG: serine/threonine protein kinase [Labilithrix sp.]|nr:serine/threonine protein kinase [Labilithrix sp.]
MGGDIEIRSEPLVAGAVIARRYRLERVLGEGGMGVVWAATEIATEKRLALKFLRAGRETELKNQERILREARAAMAVAHPNVAKVHAVLETNAGVPFIVMDLLEGRSLRAVLERRRTLSPVEAARILVPALDAVAAAHAQGIVHRDLKPENIFLTKGDDVRVLDFGIAKQLPKEEEEAQATSLTSTGAILGTPVYMAPEQVFGDEDVDGRADVWALGIILYECLAGKRPTDGGGFGPILKRITTDTLVPLEEAKPGLPKRVTRLVKKMLSRIRDERPSLDEARAVLASLLADEPVVSERDPEPLPEDAGATQTPDAMARPASEPPRRGGFPLRAALAIAGASVIAVVVFGARSLLVRGAAVADADAGAPLADAGEPWRRAADLMQRATAARGLRDGAGCVRDLDTLDRLPTRSGPPSTDGTSGYAPVRAECMMLAGDCEGGKKVYRAWIQANNTAALTPNAVERTVETQAAKSCEGDALSPRDALLRANDRLMAVEAGIRAATASECKQWHDTEVRLAPKIPPRGPDDAVIENLPLGMHRRAAACLARANDCEAALKIFREGWVREDQKMPASDPTTREARMRLAFDGVAIPTPCRGKP